ncbi:BON domain-containing protein [Nitrosovibrio sp. Nv17]|jgi:hyperosmotically inducible protein|uniref:BON domain-containing protein n=1 Tax=Nitrosovibrio sp. Nv17 TaxID=1855339 RepID=UPI00090903DB|nr:BON domain-containing protein [Nitrosovibrio sp. Nv17]SFW16057.1 hyperosmotically inducible protein [Nitrosovibrio sp. Nv17]
MDTHKKELSVLIMALAISWSLAGCGKEGEKPAPPPEQQPGPATTIGTEVDDSAITASVKSALLTDPDVKGLDITVETRKGEVLMSGFVDSQYQIDRALTLARGVDGVRSVDNRMNVKTGETTVGEKIDDAIVTTRVKAALLADETVKSFDIAVATRDGDVQLSGFVDNQAQIDQATAVVRGLEGVKNVINELSVKH